MGIEESTLRANVADLPPTGRRATAYGVFAGVVGAASLAGGALVGALCSHSIPVLDTVVAAIRGLALAPLFTTRLRRA
ncbi:hypothetical protein [Streptomyces sp. WM6378]|uniref:hypothetical protein n=1 Tax=Streptomyces sp. WM6378 TaxID=1415557 RepID=UPI0006AE07C4|nr:hypothetical protein [Streptomyces sp. WM6378]KOU54390.1 hypothetical protein ADK54_01795 [Streptomyces sp. WM6378]